MTAMGLHGIVKSTTLESNKSLNHLIAVAGGTQHGDERHLDLLDARASVWRT